MRNTFVIAGIFALATALGPTLAMAQSGSAGGMAGQASGAASAQSLGQIQAGDGGRASFARADKVKSHSMARTRGANQEGFCPPGQAKKSGSGSRFQC